MHAIGVVEMLVGGVILAGYTQLGGYVAATWLCGIAVNLLTTGHYFDVAVRDVAMAIAAFTLAQLTEVGAGAEARAFERQACSVTRRPPPNCGRHSNEWRATQSSIQNETIPADD